MLDGKLVEDATALDMKYVDDHQVCSRVSRAHRQATGGKVIGLRWAIMNNEDSSSPGVRARLVGREFKTGADDTLFASTPPPLWRHFGC